MTASDAELVRTADARAFGELYGRHVEAVHGWFAARVAWAAADLTAETFARAWLARRTFRDERDGSALPWLLGIATNVLRRFARQEEAMLRAYARTGIDPAVEAGDTLSVERLGVQRELAGALAALRAEHREVLLLHALGELSNAEIAAALDVPEGTVKAWLHRARMAAASHLAAAGVVSPRTTKEAL